MTTYMSDFGVLMGKTTGSSKNDCYYCVHERKSGHKYCNYYQDQIASVEGGYKPVGWKGQARIHQHKCPGFKLVADPYDRKNWEADWGKA